MGVNLAIHYDFPNNMAALGVAGGRIITICLWMRYGRSHLFLSTHKSGWTSSSYISSPNYHHRSSENLVHLSIKNKMNIIMYFGV